MDELKASQMDDYLDLAREFETKKREFSSKRTEKVTIRIPGALPKLFEERETVDLKERIARLPFGKEMEIKGSDKIRIEPQTMKRLFDGPLDQLMQHIKQILEKPEMENVENILLVGGFGESNYAQERIAVEFMEKRLLVPKEAGLVVLKGAVRFGHDPGSISSRIMRYTYGFRACTPYNETIHFRSEVSLAVAAGELQVDNSFVVLAQAESEIEFGEERMVFIEPMNYLQECTTYSRL